MTTDSTAAASPVIVQSDLLGRVVIKPDTAEEVGRVGQLWLDGKAHQIVGLECKAGVLGFNRHAYNWLQIASIGPEGVILKAHIGPEPSKPQTVVAVVGSDVWTDGGSRAGIVVDYRLDPASGRVVDYLFATDGWGGLTKGVYRLHPAGVISIGDRRLVCTVSAAEAAELDTPGITQRVEQVKDFVKDDYTRTRQDIAQIKQGIAGLVGKVQDNAQSLTEQTKATLTDRTTQIQQTAEQAAAQAKTKLSDAAARLQETTEQGKAAIADTTSQLKQTTEQTAAKARETLSDLTEQVQNTTQQLADQTQDAIADLKQRRQPDTQPNPPAANSENSTDSPNP